MNCGKCGFRMLRSFGSLCCYRCGWNSLRPWPGPGQSQYKDRPILWTWNKSAGYHRATMAEQQADGGMPWTLLPADIRAALPPERRDLREDGG